MVMGNTSPYHHLTSSELLFRGLEAVKCDDRIYISYLADTVCQARVNAVITNPCCKHTHLATFVSTTRAIIML